MTIAVLMLCSNCTSSRKEILKEQWKDEILETESAFSRMAQNEGIAQAFITYAAEDVVLLRNEGLIIGKEALEQMYEKQYTGKGIKLSWKPDFVDVASSGDLGYTYGHYVYTMTDSLGKQHMQEGVFHTVWKKQPDGKWRFVWD